MSRGLYRTRGIGGLPNDAHVTDGAIEMDIPEALYRAGDYIPFFGNLSWKEDYLAAKAAGVPKKESKGHRNTPRPQKLKSAPPT
jgi:hypothetical protein